MDARIILTLLIVLAKGFARKPTTVQFARLDGTLCDRTTVRILIDAQPYGDRFRYTSLLIYNVWNHVLFHVSRLQSQLYVNRNVLGSRLSITKGSEHLTFVVTFRDLTLADSGRYRVDLRGDSPEKQPRNFIYIKTFPEEDLWPQVFHGNVPLHPEDNRYIVDSNNTMSPWTLITARGLRADIEMEIFDQVFLCENAFMCQITSLDYSNVTSNETVFKYKMKYLQECEEKEGSINVMVMCLNRLDNMNGFFIATIVLAVLLVISLAVVLVLIVLYLRVRKHRYEPVARQPPPIIQHPAPPLAEPPAQPPPPEPPAQPPPPEPPAQPPPPEPPAQPPPPEPPAQPPPPEPPAQPPPPEPPAQPPPPEPPAQPPPPEPPAQPPLEPLTQRSPPQQSAQHHPRQPPPPPEAELQNEAFIQHPSPRHQHPPVSPVRPLLPKPSKEQYPPSASMPKYPLDSPTQDSSEHQDSGLPATPSLRPQSTNGPPPIKPKPKRTSIHNPPGQTKSDTVTPEKQVDPPKSPKPDQLERVDTQPSPGKLSIPEPPDIRSDTVEPLVELRPKDVRGQSATDDRKQGSPSSKNPKEDLNKIENSEDVPFSGENRPESLVDERRAAFEKLSSPGKG